jgi:hypothetical protein
MKIMKASKLLKWGALIITMMITGIEINAQEVGMPGGLFLFGNNSSNQPTANESIDSVTVGSTTLQYWAQPDPLLVPDPVNTYLWTITGGIGSQNSGLTSNLATFNFTTVGTGNIGVTEKSVNGCLGAAVTIPVAVIAAPTISNVTFSAIPCPPAGTVPPYVLAGPTATLTISTSCNGEERITVIYNLTGPAGFTAQNGVVANLGNATTINLSGTNLPQPGTYTMEIVSVTDRISQKSGITTTLNTNYTFVVNRTPITGPIYHLPNY